MPDCPDDIELAGFLNESLSGDCLERVSGHVDGCPACQARLDRLTEHTSGVVARYKELSSAVLPDARSGVSGDADTQITGARPLTPPLVGLPAVPGFDVIGEIGRGGMGVVYKARHRRLNRLVALKMILAGTAADPRVVQRFQIEAQVLARIQHPQVVQVYEVDTYQGPNGVPIPYLAMELLEGGSLSRKLRENNTTTTGPRWPSPRAAAALVEGIAHAVHTAHLRGVIHRDLKPGNILFDKDEGGRIKDEKKAGDGTASPFIHHSSSSPKVMDFGLAKFTHEAGADLTQTGQVVGTPHYMAPEQAAGGRDIGPAADVYALGAILYECLCGRPPFTGTEPVSVLLKVVHELPPDVRTLRRDVPRDLAAVTMKCLEKDPARRYASAEALADDLRRFLEDRPTRARPATTRERAWLWAKRNPTVASLIAALAVVLLVAFATVAVLWVRAEGKAEDEAAAKRRSESAEAAARREAEEVRRQQKLADLREARLEFARAVASCEEGRVEAGMRQFVEVVAIAERIGEPGLARAARTNLAAWARELAPVHASLSHTAQPRLAAFAPDGKHLVTAGRGGEVHLWETAAGTKVRTFTPVVRLNFGPATYWTVAFTPDGKSVAVGGTDGHVTIWDTDREERRVHFAATGSNVWSLAFAPDGTLWTADGAGGVKHWDVATAPRPKLLAHLTPPGPEPGIVNVLVLTPDGKKVYTGDRDGVIREWDAARGTPGRTWYTRWWVQDLAVSPDGTRLATTGPEGVARVYNLGTGALVLSLDLAGAYGNGVAFAPRRPFLVTTDGDGNVRFWHRETGQPVGTPLRFRGEVTRPRFRSEADEFAVPAGDSVCVCRVPAVAGELVTPGYNRRVRGLAFAPGGGLLAVDTDPAFEVFDLRNGTRVQRAVPTTNPLDICFDPDPARSRVFRGTRDGLDVIDVPGGRAAVHVPALLKLRVNRIEPAPVRPEVFALTQWVVARIDTRTLERLAVSDVSGRLPAGVELGTMAVRPDGAEVLVTMADRVLFLNAETLAVTNEWRADDEVFAARYTPDGTRVLVGRRDNVAELLDTQTGKRIGLQMPHTRAVVAVGVSPDGRVLATGSRDGTARFWDAETGLPLAAPLRHIGPVTHLVFTPDGARLVTGTATGQVTRWTPPPAPADGTVEELRARYAKPE